ncbi:MAG: hypothetical protein FWB96_06605 [Defluviitaleaceae bacterium]|nr:hypothetical protein [Defluviitaleaceae bacterium]MCL2263327.1 hypothetical protein [Defluviitaleaceae bacterium]
MTAKEMLELLRQMNNRERNEYLDMLYAEYFDIGVPFEKLLEEGRILEAYYSGELVEA